jgi:hypothetical protein
MSFVIEYKLKKGFIPTKDTIKTCDESRKAMQTLLIETAKIASPKTTWLIWLMTRFYQRRITEESISYEFYLFPSDKKHEVSTR